MIKNNKIARKKQEARGKKQEISGFEGSEGIKKGAIIRRCGPISFLGSK